MESSYKLIKSDYIEQSGDEFVIDTDLDSIVEEVEEEEVEEEVVEEFVKEDMTDEEKLRVLQDIDEYKKKVNIQIESERKNILEVVRIDAEKEAIELKEEAQKKGYEVGYKIGYSEAINEAKLEAAKIKSDALDLLDQVKDYNDKYLRENEQNIYSMAKAMAEKIIDYVVDIKDENILLLIKPILLEYLKEEDVTITSNEKGKLLLEKHKEKLVSICPNTRFVFLEDKSIEENGFIIEDKESIVDLQVKLQLENMLKEISGQDE